MAGKVLMFSNGHQLLARWRQGDEHATRALFERHRDDAFRLAYALLRDRADAEDAAQDALIDALLRPELYDPRRASFSTWLHAIVVNRCRRQRRTAQRRLAAFWRRWRLREAPVSPPTPEASALDRELTAQLWDAIGELSEPLREALVLRVWGDHSYAELGHILDCPARTAQSRVRLAMEALRVTLPENPFQANAEAL
jgi:RNA polymerase sigma-70 factor (ECF subfamily)